MIAPFKTGLELDREAWQSPPDSFSSLDNFHIEHGFLERRNGYRYLAKNSADLDNGTAVTGFANFINKASGSKTFLAFDTLSVYSYNGLTQTFTKVSNSVGGATSLFTGDSNDFFWCANWQSTSPASNVNRLYFSNGINLSGTGATAQDGIWYYDGATATSFVPFAGTGSTIPIQGCKLIFLLGQRLVLLNTRENGTSYPQRARWCAKQNPDEVTGWVDSVAGGGDFADAATGEQIISAQIVQNQIIVFFTDSVWTLIPVADPNKAFRWQKINSFRSTEGKMGTVEYDRYVGSVGSRGITATDGVNTTRIDQPISTFTVENMSQENLDETFCLRDFANRRWWTLYSENSTDTTKTKALIRDEDSGGFSTYSITLNCLGRATQGYSYKYEDFTAANGFEDPDGNDIRYEDFNNDETYSHYLFNESNEDFVGGDYTGGVFVLESGNSDDGDEIEAEFQTAAWNPFYAQGTEALFSYIDIYVSTSLTAIATISFYKNSEETPYLQKTMDFLPPQDYVASIQNITQDNPAEVSAGQHGLSTGEQIYIYDVEGMESINSNNKASPYTVTVIDENTFTLDGEDSTGYNAYVGSGFIFENPFYHTKIWKRVYSGGIGFQHRIGFSSTSSNKSFRIHGFKPTFKPRGRRLINS